MVAEQDIRRDRDKDSKREMPTKVRSREKQIRSEKRTEKKATQTKMGEADKDVYVIYMAHSRRKEITWHWESFDGQDFHERASRSFPVHKNSCQYVLAKAHHLTSFFFSILIRPAARCILRYSTMYRHAKMLQPRCNLGKIADAEQPSIF